MQVFKAFFKIVNKRIVTVIMYFVIFIGIAIAMGQMGQNNDVKKFSAEKLTIAIDNADKGNLGEELTKYLKKSNKIVTVPKSNDKLMDKIYCREIDYVLYIPQNFTEEFARGNRDNILKEKTVPSSSSGEFASNQIQGFLKTVGAYEDSGFKLDEAVKNANEDCAVNTKVEFIDNSIQQSVSPGAFYFRYLPYIFICTMMSTVTPVFMAFNKKEISARNKVSAMSFSNRNMQMIAGSLIVALVNMGILVIVASMIYPSYMFSVKGIVSICNALIQVMFALAAAFLVAQFVNKEEAVNMASNLIGLSLAFLGGIFVPLEIFTDGVLRIAKFMPTYWYVISIEAISKMTKFTDWSIDITKGFIIQGLYCVAILLIGLIVNRMKAKE